jgi:hypothetical protein
MKIRPGDVVFYRSKGRVVPAWVQAVQNGEVMPLLDLMPLLPGGLIGWAPLRAQVAEQGHAEGWFPRPAISEEGT